jgi:hypothetical protein
MENKADVNCIGMKKEDALVLIEKCGFVARITKEDGEDYLLTMDLRDDRLNLVVVGGVVVEASRG